MANIYRQSQLFRAALIRRERRAATELAGIYTKMFASVQKELDQLLVRLVTERSAGLIAREQQLRMLLAQIEAQATRFTAIAVSKITAEQAKEIEHGAEDALNLLRRAYTGAPPGLTISFAQLPQGVIESMVGNLGDGSPLRTLLNSFGPQASREISALLINSIGAGRSLRSIARDMHRLTQEPLARTLLVSRTEVLRAYRQGSISTYQANKDVVKGWTWVSAASARTCFPAGTIVSGPRAANATSRYYSGELVTIRTASGKEVSFTPNHPILTPQGWVAGGLLKVGDNVISSTDSQWAGLGMDENNYQIPSAIEKVFDSFPVVSAEMPSAAPDFHGDGIGSDVYVVGSNTLLGDHLQAAFGKPVSKQSFVRGNINGMHIPLPTFGYRDGVSDGLHTRAAAIPEQWLAFSDWNLGATSPHRLGQFAGSNVLPTQRGIDCITVDPEFYTETFNRLTGQESFSNFFIRESQTGVPSETPGIGVQSETFPFGSEQSSFLQDGYQPFAADAESWRDLLGALAGKVSSDRILDVNIRRFSGHVYNLETPGHWYSANGIIAHNCMACWMLHGTEHEASEEFSDHPNGRCTPVPLTKSWAELGIAGMPEQPAIPSGQSQFLMLPASEQRRIMGGASYAAWRDGAVRLEDFVGVKQSSEWGTTHYRRSLREILGDEGAQPYYSGKIGETQREAA